MVVSFSLVKNRSLTICDNLEYYKSRQLAMTICDGYVITKYHKLYFNLIYLGQGVVNFPQLPLVKKRFKGHSFKASPQQN